MNKTLEYYCSLPYTIELVPDSDDDGWFVAVKELPGCMSQGDTAEEALEMIRDAMEGWIEVALEEGIKIPEPRNLVDYSGKFVARVPRSLHRELVERAAEEGISLNQYINVLLAHAIGDRALTTPQNDPFWPGLKQSVRHALRCAGMEEEASELDEQLFADYVERSLEQIEAAIQSNYIRDAVSDLKQLESILALAERRSPALSAFRRTINLLQALLQQDLVKREMLLRSQIQQRVQETSQGWVTGVAHETRVRYSRVSMEPTTVQMPKQIPALATTSTEW